jgi:hypothetical protein
MIYGIAGFIVLIGGTAAAMQFHSHGGTIPLAPQPKTITIAGTAYKTMASFPHDAGVQLTGKPDNDLIYSYNDQAEEYSFSTIQLTKDSPDGCGPLGATLGSLKVYGDDELGEVQDYGLTQQQLDSYVKSGTAKKLQSSYLALGGGSTYGCDNKPKTSALVEKLVRQDPVKQLLGLVKSGSLGR